MNIVLLVVALILGLIVVVAASLYIRARLRHRKLNDKRFERIRPLFDKLKRGEGLESGDVFPFAASYVTRNETFLLLNRCGKSDLFPVEYYSLIRASESQLANWLEFPTELDAIPDEIEYMRRVSMDPEGVGEWVHYEVFKYRVHEPHWAAEYGWILGVVGPYFDDSRPYDHAGATFSRVSSTVDTVSPEDEAQWVHAEIALKK